MGFSEKHQIEAIAKESEGKKWVIAGIGIRAPLKPVSTKVRDGGDDDDGSTTPTARESRVPENWTRPPPPPRKRRPVAACQMVREFFVPPDLESVFVCNAERAN